MSTWIWDFEKTEQEGDRRQSVDVVIEACLMFLQEADFVVEVSRNRAKHLRRDKASPPPRPQLQDTICRLKPLCAAIKVRLPKPLVKSSESNQRLRKSTMAPKQNITGFDIKKLAAASGHAANDPWARQYASAL